MALWNFERTVTTKCGESSERIPGPLYSIPPQPPERKPHDALSEAYVVAADKARDMAASSETPENLAKVVAVMKEIEASYLSKARIYTCG